MNLAQQQDLSIKYMGRLVTINKRHPFTKILWKNVLKAPLSTALNVILG